MGYFALAVYILCLSFILLYSLAQGHLTWLYLRAKQKGIEPTPSLPEELPVITVQLPIYNELYVSERLLNAVALLDYPLEKLEIQVLDDSTDETAGLVAEKVASLKKTGLDISLVTRAERTGFKAGALANGLAVAKGEFVAIFDADFLPDKNFLLNTVPYFNDPEIGLVQTRWEHLNRRFNILTRLMSMALDAHFTIEQKGRNSSGKFINFNGTAGIWRRTCIENAGGWSADTLTEDLDLSYRAQLKGWRMKYLEEVVSPAEIPAYMQAIRTQQYRWNKGGAEVARKNLRNVLKARIPLTVKAHALFHLLNTGIFICIFFAGFLSVPVFFFLADGHIDPSSIRFVYVFFIGFLILSGFYWISLRQRNSSAWRTSISFLFNFPIFLSMSMGLSLFNMIAVIEGYLGIRTPFVRTPKFNIVGARNDIKKNKYVTSRPPLITIAEGLLAIYFSYAVYMGFVMSLHAFILFHLMLAIGFGGVFFFSIKHSVIRI